EGGPLPRSDAAYTEVLVLEPGSPGRLGALGLRARQADGEGVVHERLSLVDDRGRQILEREGGDEFSEPNGERRLFHNMYPRPCAAVAHPPSVPCGAVALGG